MNEGSFISLPIAAASRMSEPTTNSPALTAVNGVPKRNKIRQPPLTVPAGWICFRLLCHASRIGGVIGKSGAIIKQLQQETSAKIRVEDPPAGCDDRVITVIANTSVNRTISFNEDNNQVSKSSIESREGSEVSPAQEALVRVLERILLVAAEVDGGYFAPGGVVSCRLLADKSLVGSLIGKTGKVIEKIRKDTGCKIRVLGQDKLPSCALSTDEMVEIEGDILAIKMALIAVSRCLQDSPAAHKTHTVLGKPSGHMVLRPPRTQAFRPSPTISANHAAGGQPSVSTSLPEIVFRMLFSSDKVGGMIGKSRTILHTLQNESGATITVGAPVSDSGDQLITISAKESPRSKNSPAQNAVILVFNRSVQPGFGKGLEPSSTGTLVSARLLISPNQVGCLLGKGSLVIAEMRKVSGAVIKIVGDHQVSKFASETDKVVMMTGEFVHVRDALYNVTGRLRNNIFFSKTSNGLGTGGNYARRNNHSNKHTTLTQSMDNIRLSSSTDHPPKPAQRQSQVGAGNPTSVKGGIELGSGSGLAIVTNMSVEIVVPENAIGSVYGENESNLTRLRQISGAKVIVHEPRSGTTNHTIIISGTPYETQSAQSLLQGFILADQSRQKSTTFPDKHTSP